MNKLVSVQRPVSKFIESVSKLNVANDTIPGIFVGFFSVKACVEPQKLHGLPGAVKNLQVCVLLFATQPCSVRKVAHVKVLLTANTQLFRVTRKPESRKRHRPLILCLTARNRRKG